MIGPLKLGQLVLVAPVYGAPLDWGRVERIKDGDGSPYPILVRFKNGQLGQFKWDEVREVKEP